MALNPFLIYFSSLLLTETLYTAILAWSLWLLVRHDWLLGRWTAKRLLQAYMLEKTGKLLPLDALRRHLALDAPVVATTAGAPIDITVDGDVLAVVDVADGVSHLTQFHVDEDGNLLQNAASTIASAANGVAIVPAR